MTRSLLISAIAMFLTAASAVSYAEEASSVSQYGITWTFDKPHTVGRFVTGDYWVLGPVTITKVSPEPGATTEAAGPDVKSIYGAVAMVDDNRMRNGSMIIDQAGGSQGYDSRLKNYDPALSIAYPRTLQPNQSLISTISATERGVPVLLNAIMWRSESKGTFALKAAAVLTCLKDAPPDDAFRPAYASSRKPIFLASNIKWDRLPKLSPPANVPDFAQFARYFQRPWLDHMQSWMLQHLGPYENQCNYGREFCRVTSISSLMLMLDLPKETREPLMRNFVQFGIDLSGLAESGRRWSADGGHWNGRKWPIMFAGLILDSPEIQGSLNKTIFSEDQQTYYGKSATGQRVLYQMVSHTGIRSPYEEKPEETWDFQDKRSEGYRGTCSVGWPGTALAVQLMKAKALWNHDAFFDYNDRWMGGKDTHPERKGLPDGRADAFVTEMWKMYRGQVPQQPGGKDNLKWVWREGNQGEFVDNSDQRPDATKDAQ